MDLTRPVPSLVGGAQTFGEREKASSSRGLVGQRDCLLYRMAGLTGQAHRRSRHKIAETSTERVFQPDFLSRNLLTSRSDVLSPHEQWPRQGEQENPVQNQSDEDESAAPLATKAHKEELYRSCHLQSNAHRTARPRPDKKIQTNQVNPRL